MSIFISILFVLIGWFTWESFFSTEQEDVTQLTLKEAVEKGTQHARKINPNFQLVYVTSVESNDGMEQEGRCRSWNLIFGIPDSYQGLTVKVENGEVVRSHQVQEKILPDVVFQPQEIRWDSPDLLKRAQEEYNLRPSQGFGKGYHFKVTKDQGYLFIGVSGWDKSGRAQTIYFNSENGKYLGMEIAN